MPKELSVSLLFRQQYNVTTSETFRTTYPLIEYLRYIPQYAPELYTLYRYSRVLAVKYRFELINIGGRPLEMFGAVMPFDDASAVSVAQIGEKPGVIRKIVSPAGGIDKATMQTTCTGQQWFGNPYFTKDYWVDEGQANNSTPLDVLAPAFAFVVAPLLTGSQIDFVVTVRLEYHIQFFDLRVSRQLGLTKDPDYSCSHSDMCRVDEISDEEERPSFQKAKVTEVSHLPVPKMLNSKRKKTNN